jgi:hypothetical protein
VSSERVGINKRIAERLRSDGRIDDANFSRAVAYATRKGMRVEEALIELDILRESILLKFIATIYKTQFVSTERMSKAKLDRDALKLVPKGMARHFGVYPLVLDRVNDKLIIATADPDNVQALDELRMSSGVERVVAMIARPEAVNAAIDRGYDGDRARFKALLAPKAGDIAEMIFQPKSDRSARARAGRGTPRHAADWSENLNPRERRGRGRPATGEFAPPPRRRTGEQPEPPPKPRRRTGRASERREEPRPQRPEPRYGQRGHDAWLDDTERDFDRQYDEPQDDYQAPRRPTPRARDDDYPPGPPVRRAREDRYDEGDFEPPPPPRGRRRTAEVPPPEFPDDEPPPRAPPARRTGRGRQEDSREGLSRGRGSDGFDDLPSDRGSAERVREPQPAPPAPTYDEDYGLTFEEGNEASAPLNVEVPAQPQVALAARSSSIFPRPIGGIGFGPMSCK